jgi:ornithine cyclodeaminase/alanine dehydrogenase-like protein (mu-crystallin family)
MNLGQKPKLAQLDDNQLNVTYDHLSEEYARAFSSEESRQRQHFKIVEVLNFDKGEAISTVNATFGRLSNNYFGTKTIYYSYEEHTKRTSITTLFNPKGKLVAVYESSELTAIRCGLMVAYAMEKIFKVDSRMKVGLIGAGKINSLTAIILHRLFGIRDFIILTRSGKAEYFDANVSNTPIGKKIWYKHSDARLEAMKPCSVIISATTNSTKSGMIGQRFVENIPLLITQDTGYLFSSSIRKSRYHYGDFPKQILAVKEIEFPYDEDMAIIPLVNLDSTPAIVSLYGTGVSDVAIAYSFYKILECGEKP